MEQGDDTRNTQTIQKYKDRYREVSVLYRGNNIRLSVLFDKENQKFMIDIRHLRDGRLTKKGVRVSVDDFEMLSNFRGDIPRIVELFNLNKY